MTRAKKPKLSDTIQQLTKELKREQRSKGLLKDAIARVSEQNEYLLRINDSLRSENGDRFRKIDKLKATVKKLEDKILADERKPIEVPLPAGRTDDQKRIFAMRDFHWRTALNKARVVFMDDV